MKKLFRWSNLAEKILSQERPADDDHPETYERAYLVKVELMQVPTDFVEQFGTNVFRETQGEKKLILNPITDSATKDIIMKLGE